MKFNRIKQRKKPNNSKLIFMLVVLLGILYFWLNAGHLMKNIF